MSPTIDSQVGLLPTLCIDFFLGSQKKTMHNVRIIRGDFLSLCKHKRGGMGDIGAGPNPERLQTAMSLYSSKLSAIIMMVDGRVNSLVGLKEGMS